MIINMSDHRDHLVQNLPEYVPQTTIPKKPQKLSFLVKYLEEMAKYIPLLETDNPPEHGKGCLLSVLQ